MIKIKGKRYNPRGIYKYFAAMLIDNPSIRIINMRGEEEDIVFKTEEERDHHLNAMDEALLIVDEGEVIAEFEDVPMIFGGGGILDPPGGISHH